jgi:hypothetical protein
VARDAFNRLPRHIRALDAGTIQTDGTPASLGDVDVPLEDLHVPGMQAVYEPPESPELAIDGTRERPLEAARRIMAFLKRQALL